MKKYMLVSERTIQMSRLIFKHLQEALTAEERRELDLWLEESEANRRLFLEITEEGFIARELRTFSSFSGEAAWPSMEERLLEEDVVFPKRRNPVLRLWMAAASVLLILTVGALWLVPAWREGREAGGGSTEAVSQAILPGGDKATLTLSDGSVIELDSATNGDIARQGAVKVMKADGSLSYVASAAGGENTYNTIRTPKGGKYRLVLADGSKVWLNSASSLRYPVAFEDGSREVEVTGEAYFEVASMPEKTFRVSVADRGSVQVTGTSFNVNAYTDERTMNTTLLEGGVRVVAPDGGVATLKPGQQAQTGDRLKVVDGVNTDEVVAWKEGWFHFNRADIGTIMRQVSRWYDVEVVFEGEPGRKTFSGVVSRENDVSQVLLIMERAGVRFRIEGRRIYVL